MASTAWRPDACIAAMVCRHEASSWRRAPAESTAVTGPPADGGRDSWWSQRRASVLRSRLLLAAVPAVFLLSASAPAQESPPAFDNEGVSTLAGRGPTV